MIVLFTELVEAIQKFLMLFSRLSVTLDQHNSNQKIFCLSRDALLPAFYENPEFILEEEIENARYGLKIGDFGIDISNIEGMVRFDATLPSLFFHRVYPKHTMSPNRTTEKDQNVIHYIGNIINHLPIMSTVMTIVYCSNNQFMLSSQM